MGNSPRKKEKSFTNILIKLLPFILAFFFPQIILAQAVGEGNNLGNQNEINTNANTNNYGDCDLENYFFKNCKLKLETDDEKTEFITNVLIAMVNNTISNVFDYVSTQNDIIIEEVNETYHLFKLVYQNEHENITSINFTNTLPHIIHEYFPLPDNFFKNIFVFKVEHRVYPYQIPIIEFILYTKETGFINFDNIKLDYYIPVKNIDEDRLYIYNVSSDFYNDECQAYCSPNGTDVTLYSRKNIFNELYLNMCDNNCMFKGYNSTLKVVICECISKTGFVSYNEIKKKVLFKFDNEKQISNIFLFKCYYLITSLDDIRENPGFYLLVFVMAFHILMMILFLIKGYSSLNQRIDEAIKMTFHPNDEENKKNTKLIVIRIKKKNNDDIKVESGRIKRSKRNKTSKSMKNIKSGGKTDKKNSVYLKKSNNNSGSKNSLVNNETSGGKKKKKRNLTTEDNKENDKSNDTIYIFENDYEINMLPFEEALRCDKRTRCEIYLSYIKSHQLFLFSFLDYNSYNSVIMKKTVFFLSFIYHYGFSACFFTDEIMDKIYLEEGKFNISNILYYTLCSSVICIVLVKLLVFFLLLTEKDILSIKRERAEERANEEKKEVMKCIIIKFIIFFFVNILLLILFWFYLTCFNAVFPHTQTFLAVNTVISFVISNLLPLAIYAIPAFFRYDILSNQKIKKIKSKDSMEYKDAQCIYSISQYFQKI